MLFTWVVRPDTWMVIVFALELNLRKRWPLSLWLLVSRAPKRPSSSGNSSVTATFSTQWWTTFLLLKAVFRVNLSEVNISAAVLATSSPNSSELSAVAWRASSTPKTEASFCLQVHLERWELFKNNIQIIYLCRGVSASSCSVSNAIRTTSSFFSPSTYAKNWMLVSSYTSVKENC